MIAGADERNQARLRVVSTKESGTWLPAVPVTTLGNLVNHNAVKIALQLRLERPICLQRF